MKKIWKENKNLLFLWLSIIIIVSLLLIFLKPSEKLNNIIQAIAIITLVFITGFYANQTQKLVEQEKISLEEEKKKRDADFWEKRINEFYKPFTETLNDIRDALHEKEKDPKKLNKLKRDFKYLSWQKGYMIPKETYKKMMKLELGILIADIDKDKESFVRFYEAEKDARKIVNNEWLEIEDKIRKFYGY